MFPKWIPTGVRYVVEKLKEAGFHAYIVGGAVRNLLLASTPKDWDVATNARPEQVMQIFTRTVPVGLKFGTVAVLTPDVGSVEITTFRRDGRYVDGRRPEEVYYTDNLLDDLSRRDLTINAMAMTGKQGTSWIRSAVGRTWRRGLSGRSVIPSSGSRKMPSA